LDLLLHPLALPPDMQFHAIASLVAKGSDSSLCTESGQSAAAAAATVAMFCIREPCVVPDNPLTLLTSPFN
jgi:hypothetical protein